MAKETQEKADEINPPRHITLDGVLERFAMLNPASQATVEKKIIELLDEYEKGSLKLDIPDQY